uniref:Maintenance of telomere capping protein 6 n=1 Tax=Zeugodacus cucurbitae TaxID=28588 RepID=A0A0A1XNS7_ZEUCU
MIAVAVVAAVGGDIQLYGWMAASALYAALLCATPMCAAVLKFCQICRSRKLNNRQIEKYLFEDIPSDSESICSDEDTEDQPNPLVLGDSFGEVQMTDYDNFNSDDDIPPSNLVLRNPESTKSNTVNSNRPAVWQWSTCKVPLCLRKGKACFTDFHKKKNLP